MDKLESRRFHRIFLLFHQADDALLGPARIHARLLAGRVPNVLGWCRLFGMLNGQSGGDLKVGVNTRYHVLWMLYLCCCNLLEGQSSGFGRLRYFFFRRFVKGLIRIINDLCLHVRESCVYNLQDF
jgi:hypothetical protein